VSAFNGPADLDSFDLITHRFTDSAIKAQKSPKRKQLEQYYGQIREYREGRNTTISRNKVFQALKKYHPLDWLLPVELYELAKQGADLDFQKELLEHLEQIKREQPRLGHLIDDGLMLIDKALLKVP